MAEYAGRTSHASLSIPHRVWMVPTPCAWLRAAFVVATRFAAASTGAGIVNWVSDYGTSDIPRTKESEFFGPPWEDKGREHLESQSPIYYAGNVTTPTLFVHGEADHRVPIEEGEQMYTALKKRNIDATFIRYPDMAHGGWTPWNMVHRYSHQLQW